MDGINLPEHWEILPFTDCLKKVETKKKPSIPKTDYQESGEFPVIDQGASFIAGWTDSVDSVISDNLPLVIFGDHTRIFKYVDFPFALGADGTKILYVNDYILDPRFFYYALSNLNVPSKGYNRHYRYLQEFSVVCPPIPEQRTIAHILQTIQEAKFARQREIALERERKAALMDCLFSHGTKGGPRKQTEIGEIPEGWEVVQLSDRANLRRENVNPKDNQNLNFVGLEHIDTGESILKRWGEASKVKSAKNHFYPDDILYGKLRSYLDKAVIAEMEGICSTDILVFTSALNTSPRFLVYLLHTEAFVNHAVATSTGISHPRTSWDSLGKFTFAFPPLSEQRTIANIFRAIDKKIAALEREVELIDELFHATLEKLMTGQLSAEPLVDTELQS
ncbi:MAG: restriction endonuclease subunit S [Candidatus Poribacteria bacterium]|nr:restriction endonuclease subunit S [Candidatus Poribacteria bacterium]